MITIIIVGLILWLTIIQVKLNKISDTLNFLQDNIYKKTDQLSVEETSKSANIQEPQSISDVSDEIIFNKKTAELPQDSIKREKPSKNFENIFLGNIFNKIGAIAILIGLIILIKIVSPYFIFTPQIKITLGYIAGFVMMIGALKLHSKENMKNYSEVLLGTGFGAMFISTYCASALFKFLNMPATVIIATAFLLAAFYLADKLKTVSMLVISLIAAYINLIFLNWEYDIPSNFLFGYLIFINILSLVYTYRNNSRNIINIINLCITFITALITCYGIHLAGPITLWALYIAYDLITPEKSKNNQILNFLNLAILTALTAESFWGEYNLQGYTQLGCTVVYAIITYLKRSKSEIFNNYINLSLTSALLFIYFICGKNPTAKCMVWSIETAILAYYAFKYRFRTLAAWAIGIWTVAYCSILPIDGVFSTKNLENYVPLWNIRLAMFTPVIISSAFAYLLLIKNKNEEVFFKLAEFFRFVCITTIYLYIGLELNNIITQYFASINTNAEFINLMTNAILCSAYAVNLKRLQMKENPLTPLLQVVSAFTGICALLLLVFAGAHYKPLDAYIPVLNIRSIAFLAGITASILYTKWTNNIVFKYLAIILGFILVHYEITDIITKYSINNGEYLISLCWIIYSGIITAIGILKATDYLKISGIVLSILSIFRIFIFDLVKVDIFYRFIAILTLGIILMILSYIYNKKTEK